MKHSVKHDLDLPTAKKATQRAFESYAERFSENAPTATWTSETRCEVSFVVKGVNIGGALEIQADEIDMKLDVPFIFRPFKSRALGIIEAEITKWLEKAKNGELS